MGPQLGAVGSLHEAHGEFHPAVGKPGRALHEIARMKLLADPLHIVGLDQERRGPRHHVETGNAGQGDRDLVGQAAGEEVLRGIAGGVRERQHGDDRPRRLR